MRLCQLSYMRLMPRVAQPTSFTGDIPHGQDSYLAFNFSSQSRSPFSIGGFLPPATLVLPLLHKSQPFFPDAVAASYYHHVKENISADYTTTRNSTAAGQDSSPTSRPLRFIQRIRPRSVNTSLRPTFSCGISDTF